MPRIEPATPLPSPHQIAWARAVDAYELAFPGEAETARAFREFMLGHADAAARERVGGHLTGSAWLVGLDGTQVLLTHHRKLDRWLQLGGHADGDTDLARVALREAEEESGLVDLVVEADIFDLDRHRIPARGDEAVHWHYDVRYVVRATTSEAFSVSAESKALAWRPIAALVDDPNGDGSLRRMARKWLRRCGGLPD